MERESNRVEPPVSEDQQAISDYFESALFREASQVRKEYPGRRYALGDWIVDSPPRAESRFLPLTSFVMGLAGLNVILLVLATLSPLLLFAMDDVISPSDGYVMMMVFIQTLILPPIIAFSVATVTPMFWYGSVLLRFLTGALMVVPGCAAFYFMMVLIEGSPPVDFLFGFAGVMFTQFLVAGSVALIVQMWSPWTLSHARCDQKPLPPLGMRAMLELTSVAAIGCAIFVIDGLEQILDGILFFAGMGFLSSLAVIAILIAFLREGRRNLLSAAVAFFAAFSMALLMCGFFAVAEYGWDTLAGSSLLLMIATSAYGAVVIIAVMSLCLSWLRICGWACINRNAAARSPDLPTETF